MAMPRVPGSLVYLYHSNIADISGLELVAREIPVYDEEAYDFTNYTWFMAFSPQLVFLFVV